MIKEEIIKSASKIVETLKNNNKILVCGNGGSMADAQHFAAELEVKFGKERKPYPAILLSSNISSLTACANDFGYNQVFERGVEAYGDKEDCLIGITTSGNSETVINAIKTAKEKGLTTICLNGKEGGLLKNVKYIDHNLIIPSHETARIQEAHGLILHIYCQIIDNYF